MILICYKKCSTCNKLEKRMKELKIEYNYREIDKENPSFEELKKWYKDSGLEIKKFFNTSGTIYKEMNLKDKLKDLSDDEKLKLLASNGMLVKRPIILEGNKIFIGPEAAKYIENLAKLEK